MITIYETEIATTLKIVWTRYERDLTKILQGTFNGRTIAVSDAKRSEAKRSEAKRINKSFNQWAAVFPSMHA
jgi:hypothetical protein